MASEIVGKAFSRETIALVRRLESQGWVFRKASNGHAVGKHEDGSRMTLAPRLSTANRAYQNALAQVKRWERAQVEAAAEADRAFEAGGPEVQALGITVQALYNGPDDPVIDGVLSAAAEKHHREVQAKLAASPPRGVDGDVGSPSSTVESRRPWKARMGSSRSKATTDYYESSTTDEVTYSDGSKMYACRFEGCDFRSDRPRSVARHFGAKHTAQGEAEKVVASGRVPIAEDVPLDVSEMRPEMHRTYSPSERLVTALSEFLESAGTLDPAALAYAALTWFHERPDLGDPEDQVREPLTDAQVLAKIRLLVGGRDVELEAKYDDLLAKYDALDSRFDDACNERDLLSVRLESVVEERDRLRGDLDAWLALAPRPAE